MADNLSIRLIEKKEEWEQFVLSQPYTPFVLSWEYGNFFERIGEKAWIWGVYTNEEELIGGALVVSTHARRGNFLFLPYGPIVSPRATLEQTHKFFISVLSMLTPFLVSFGKKNGYDFIRVSPFMRDDGGLKKSFQALGFRDAPMHVLSETTWMLDVRPSSEILLSHMKKNHRNLIRRCEREGVRVVEKTDTEALTQFNFLHDTTVKRHRFHRFSKKYIIQQYESFAPRGIAHIFQAYLPDGRLDASAIIFYYGTMAAYYHGASLNLNSRLPSSYLLQWTAIQEAKKQGMLWYNFWGIAPENASSNHPFHGITHFKRGFGGELFNLIHCQDFPISKKYWMNWLIETLRKFRRGFS